MKSKFLIALGIVTTLFFAAPSRAADQTPPRIGIRVDQALSLAPSPGLAQGSRELAIRRPGAAFIKVHFARLALPAGAYVEVVSPDGREAYRYDGTAASRRTLDDGDDGVTRFSAISISGEAARVRLVLPAGSLWGAEHGVEIDGYMAGDPARLAAAVDPESTCGINERRDVACWQGSHPTEVDRARPVVRLLIGGRSLCTGWRVGATNRLFTNNHCLASDTEVRSTEVWFNYQKTSCNGSEYAGTVKVTGAELLKTDYALDYSLFTVNDFAQIAGFGHLGLEVRPPSLGELIYIPQHGAGNPKELAIESDQNSGGLCQIDVAVTNGRATDSDTGYYCDTIGGSSGSPVLAAASNRVLALHHFGGCENQGVRIDKIWPQVAGYFDDQIPSGDDAPAGEPPQAAFTVDCQGLTCRLDGAASRDRDGLLVAYDWDFGDGQQGRGVRLDHAFAAAGLYRVGLTVTDDDGLSARVEQEVRVVDGQGFPYTGLSAQRGEWRQYRYLAPAGVGKVQISLSGGAGDADLYVRRGAEPTTTEYECRPYQSGNTERCLLDVTPGETLYIGIHAFLAYDGVTLDAR